MRILLLVDDLSIPEAQHDAEFALYRLDRDRLQVEICALRSGVPGVACDLRVLGTTDPLAYFRLYRYVQTQQIELIHALEPAAWNYAALVARFADIPAVASVYHVQAGLSWIAQKLVALKWAGLRRSLDQICVPSEVVQRDLWYTAAYPQERMHVLYPGFAVPEHLPEPPARDALGLPDGPLVTVVALDTADDGYLTLLEALPRIRGRVTDVRIVVAGSSGTLERWKGAGARTAMEVPIRWLPDRADIDRIAAASNAVLIHPEHEGIPDILPHLMAAGCAIVATRVGGITDIIEHGVTGLLVTPGDVRDFALQTTRLLTQPPFAEKIARQTHAQALRLFSQETKREALTTFYETTIYSRR